MCGLAALFRKRGPAAPELASMLHLLTHRGPESARFWVRDFNGKWVSIGGFGTAGQAFHHVSEETMDSLLGNVALGHARYGTSKGRDISTLQPIKGMFNGLVFFLAHNGNLVNVEELRKKAGSLPTATDSRIIVDLISSSRAETFEAALVEVAQMLKGSFALNILYEDELWAIQDRYAYHPLLLGRRGEDWFIASEDTPFKVLGADVVRNIRPGELIHIDADGRISSRFWTDGVLRFDPFEYIYIALVSSTLWDVHVGMARRQMGRYIARLFLTYARERDLSLDERCVIFPVPSSGNQYAHGVWEEFKAQGYTEVAYEPHDAIFRNHGVGRTFQQPGQEQREFLRRFKFIFQPQWIAGRTVIIVDDSIVRGTVSPWIVHQLRLAGAERVYLLVGSDLYLSGDLYGSGDTYRVAGELIAQLCKNEVLAGKIGDERVYTDTVRQQIIEGVRQQINRKVVEEFDDDEDIPALDGLFYLPIQTVLQAILDVAGPNSPLTRDHFYIGPFTGLLKDYPSGVGDFAASVGF